MGINTSMTTARAAQVMMNQKAVCDCVCAPDGLVWQEIENLEVAAAMRIVCNEFLGPIRTQRWRTKRESRHEETEPGPSRNRRYGKSARDVSV